MRSTRRPSWSDRLLGLAPRPVPPFIFEVDEGAVRFGRFQAAEGGVRFLEYQEIDLPEGLFQSGVLGGPLRDDSSFAELLGQLVPQISLPVREASLVLPDRWFRVSFVEVGEMPRSAEEREEVLRWKLKRVVPFRVEDLRVRAESVAPLPEQEEPGRVLIGYALERLLAQLEDAFEGQGIQLGLVTSRSLALLGGLSDVFPDDRLSVLASVRDGAYSLTFAAGKTPLLHRYKEQRGTDSELEGSLISRDLRLTRSFLQQHFPDLPLGRVLVTAPEEVVGKWKSWLTEGLGEQAEPLHLEHLPLVGDGHHAPWEDAMAMIGASRLEVA